MSKVSHQAKVYNMLKEANGPVTVEQLLSIEGLLPYKLSAYVLYAKIDFGAVIKPIRDGRKVTAYELTDPGTGVPARKTKTVTAKPVKTAKTPKVKAAAVKPAKTPKTKKTVAVAPVVNELENDPIVSSKNDKIVDILDEMDTSVASFEDREFAKEFVRSL